MAQTAGALDSEHRIRWEVPVMARFVVLVTLGAAFAMGAVACGDGNGKPPLTPDSEHPGMMEVPDAEAPGTEPAAEPVPEPAPEPAPEGESN